MPDILFHRCEMHHEKFIFPSNSDGNPSHWKRNSLCPSDLRSKNILCAHGTAILRISKDLESKSSELKNQLLNLQYKLFSIDHQKGEMEKYVFEQDPEFRSIGKQKLRILMIEYDKVCDELEDFLVQNKLMPQ